MSVFAVTGEFNGLAVAIFAVVLAITLLITRWAASRTKTPPSSTPPAAGSAAAPTAWRSRATTCRPRRSWATPA